MSDTNRHDEGGNPAPGDPVPPPLPRHQPPASRELDPSVGEDRFLLIAEKILGTAMMFIGFLNVLLSISGGYEINIVPLLIYCGGLFVWAHAAVINPTARYTVMATAVVLGLAHVHFGEVLFWHKQVVFWGTVILVVVFMFKSAPKPEEGPDDRGDRDSRAE